MKNQGQGAVKRQEQLIEAEADDLLEQARREQGILRKGGLHIVAKKLIMRSINGKLDRAGELLDGKSARPNSNLNDVERQALIR